MEGCVCVFYKNKSPTFCRGQKNTPSSNFALMIVDRDQSPRFVLLFTHQQPLLLRLLSCSCESVGRTAVGVAYRSVAQVGGRSTLSCILLFLSHYQPPHNPMLLRFS